MSAPTQAPTAGAAGSVPTAAAKNATPEAMAAPGYTLDLHQIQGNILGGFNKDFQSFLFLRFTDEAMARKWVGSVAGEVATAYEWPSSTASSSSSTAAAAGSWACSRRRG